MALKISILIHNLNRASIIEHCLSSVAQLTYRPLEVIILDAGSSDSSLEKIGRAAKIMQGANIEVRVISCRPMGVASSRNFAAAQATGRLLCALDNDASFDSPDSLESIKKAFDSNHRLGVISFRILRGDASEIDPFAWVFRRSPQIWADREFHTFTFTGGGFCARKEAFWAAGGFWDHLKYSREEEDLGLALLDKGWHIVYNSKVIVRHYADPGGRINLVQRRLFELRNGICRFLC